MLEFSILYREPPLNHRLIITGGTADARHVHVGHVVPTTDPDNPYDLYIWNVHADNYEKKAASFKSMQHLKAWLAGPESDALRVKLVSAALAEVR